MTAALVAFGFVELFGILLPAMLGLAARKGKL